MTLNSIEHIAFPTNEMLKLFIRILTGVLLLLVMHFVSAETLKDPTQPPMSSGVISQNNQVMAGPVLQSVMIGPKYRAAIISGKKVMLNGKYENSTLIKVSDREVVLLNSDRSTQTLDMAYVSVKKIRSADKSDDQHQF